MIKLDIIQVVFFYILFSVISIFIIWLAFGHKERRKVLRRSDIDYIWRCEICFYNYIDSRHEDISVCPLCGSYNKKGKDSANGEVNV